jgi:tRNA 2-thiouridine synthesizing protein E
MAAVSRYHDRFESPQAPLQFDAGGFLADPCNWTAEASRVIAEMDGVGPLGPEHWRVIMHLRFRYLLHCTLLSVRRLSEDCEARDNVRRLFGSCKTAWRVAGLPDPGEEAKAYMN